VLGRRGLATLLLFLYVTEEAGRIYVRDMPWPPAAECNMITNKQTNLKIYFCTHNLLKRIGIRGLKLLCDPFPLAMS